MKKVSRKIILDVPTKFGIFASSLLVATTAVYIWSPVIESNATDNLTTQLSANINPVASITLDTYDLVFNVTPTDAGVFQSSPITATVASNSLGGYELYFSSEDNNTNMIHSDSSIANVIASDFNGTVTSSTMAKDKWGYSLDNTNFSKIPTATSQVQLRNIDHYPSAAEQANTVYIGTKISSNLPSGTYSKNVKFSVLAHETPEPPEPVYDFSTITTMQEMTPEVCAGAEVLDEVTLKDTRDNKNYRVMKTWSEQCWMKEDLAIENKTLTTSESDVASNFTLPASVYNVDANNWLSESNAIHIYSSSSSHGANEYTWYAATAGTGQQNTVGNTNYSVCPKGWKLPTKSEWITLGETAGYGGENESEDLWYGLTHDSIMLWGDEDELEWWAATGKDQTFAYSITASGNISVPYFSMGDYGYDNKNYVARIRCIAR